MKCRIRSLKIIPVVRVNIIRFSIKNALGLKAVDKVYRSMLEVKYVSYANIPIIIVYTYLSKDFSIFTVFQHVV